MSDSKLTKIRSGSLAEVPKKETVDHLLAALRGGISAVPVVGGVGAELFAALVGGPYERRLQVWMEDVSRTLARIADTDPNRFRDLFDDEEFLDLLVAATRAAINTHRQEKRRWLASTISQCAQGSPLEFDSRLAFIRFADELTPSHIALLRQLDDDSERVESLASYSDLHACFLESTTERCSSEEFKLLCNDLSIRVLARFSETLDDFPGLAVSGALLTEDSGTGSKVYVSGLGRAFLRFIAG